MLLLQTVELYSPVKEEGGEGEGMRRLQVLVLLLFAWHLADGRRSHLEC